jgi:hypothetical protein
VAAEGLEAQAQASTPAKTVARQRARKAREGRMVA